MAMPRYHDKGEVEAEYPVEGVLELVLDIRPAHGDDAPKGESLVVKREPGRSQLLYERTRLHQGRHKLCALFDGEGVT